MKTTFFRPDTVARRWVLIDATGQSVGRLAVVIANILRGKDKPEFTPNAMVGDNVVVVNSSKMIIDPKKGAKTVYYHHSFYPGGLKETNWNRMLETRSDFLLKHVVHGMVPKNTLGKEIMSNLRVYQGPEHPHQAQKPVEVKVG
ncbi:MAG: 50S ribosomal protein L13 [Caldisericota bacterium]|jgi:large subunit ribosomal protein L13|nr:50S ribosomal protein L13 [Caldisericota bacterium]